MDQHLLEQLKAAKPCFYANVKKQPAVDWYANLPITEDQILDAEARLRRFAPLLERYFPETAPLHGIIESPLVEIPAMKQALEQREGRALPGRLYLKKDSHLAVAGSVKARGGIYEILKHAEDLVVEKRGFDVSGDCVQLSQPEYRAFFAQHTIQVGSTGNLGLSIGMISAKLGFNVVVHMSADAKQWKKDLLRHNGVTVVEYASDYSKAVEEGRRASDADPNSYFVDDENSLNLFLGYAVSALRLKGQLEQQGIAVDSQHPLVLYIPCGVGGAPGGVTYGCKYVFGQDLYAYFVEPVQACCMLLGMASGKHDAISVQDIGLSGVTNADGLAVGRASKLVGKLMEPILDGLFTVDDAELDVLLKELHRTEGVFVEPSACAGFYGYAKLLDPAFTGEWALRGGVVGGVGESAGGDFAPAMAGATHLVWATGGSLVPEAERARYLA